METGLLLAARRRLFPDAEHHDRARVNSVLDEISGRVDGVEEVVDAAGMLTSPDRPRHRRKAVDHLPDAEIGVSVLALELLECSLGLTRHQHFVASPRGVGT